MLNLELKWVHHQVQRKHLYRNLSVGFYAGLVDNKTAMFVHWEEDIFACFDAQIVVKHPEVVLQVSVI